MSYLTADDKAFFKENGYLIKRDVLSEAQIQAAQDALWSGIEADRNDAKTWVGAGPRVPVPSSHPAIMATLHDAPVFAMAEEMVGKDRLNPNAGPGPHLVYPSGDGEWKLPGRGHLDGYYTPTNGVPEGTVGVWQICATIYVDDVRPRGAGFTLWPGTHRAATEFFRNHSLLSLKGGVPEDHFPTGEPLEVTGPAGTVCFWHGQLVHSGSKNVNDNIRMALIARLARKDITDILFESPDDMWVYWDGLRS
jgi:hypothetical protein